MRISDGIGRVKWSNKQEISVISLLICVSLASCEQETLKVPNQPELWLSLLLQFKR
jgi:hypothetical protein